MNISAALVRQLRDATGISIMECKKALVETEGELSAAEELLSARSHDVLSKKAARETSEGLVAARLSDDASACVLVKLCCETDFVARNPGFVGYAGQLAALALESGATTVDALEQADGVGDILAGCAQLFGENTRIGDVVRIEGDFCAFYVHDGGRLAAAIAIDKVPEDDELAVGIAMQVAAMEPQWLAAEDVPEDVHSTKLTAFAAEAVAAGKDLEIASRIADGRYAKFVSQACLLEQSFIKDGDVSVRQLVESTGFCIVDFARLA